MPRHMIEMFAIAMLIIVPVGIAVRLLLTFHFGKGVARCHDSTEDQLEGLPPDVKTEIDPTDIFY